MRPYCFKMNIGVTSKNKLKLEAVEDAYFELGWNPNVTRYETDSKVGEQPVGDQTLLGARNRIKSMGDLGDLNLDGIISLENGIFDQGSRWMDMVVGVYFDVNSRTAVVRYSKEVEFPKEYVEEACRRGFDTTTIGEVMAEKGFIEDAKDPHWSISGISRKDYLQEVVQSLLWTIK